MAAIPETQQAWYVTARGAPADVLQFREDAPVPRKLCKGEALVRVQAAALNPIGYKIMANVPAPLARRPYVPEHDLAGVVVDANGTEFKAGDEVFGFIETPLHLRTGQGTLAQYVRVQSSVLARRPQNATAAEAAGLALVGCTAYQALFENAKLQPGQRIFVNGGSTAVGIVAIQLAKNIGCWVAASASGRNEEFLRELGVDEFFDYTAGPLHETLIAHAPSPKFDVVFETVGLDDSALFFHSEAYLAPDGVFVSVALPAASDAWNVLLRPGFAGGVKRRWKLVAVQCKKAHLEKLAEYVLEGKLRPVLDSVYDFRDAHQAYERITSKRARGKVVLKIDEVD